VESIVKDDDCIQFLRWSLVRLRMRWDGFRKVRGQVCKRIVRRMHDLGIADIGTYRSFLEKNDVEWTVLDSLCRITISRFYRDREVFRFLEEDVFVKLSQNAVERGDSVLRCWSIGCASGEEPYTLAILWNLVIAPRFPCLELRILATDADIRMVGRAVEGRYAAGSLAHLPAEWTRRAFIRKDGRYCIKDEVREKICFVVHDIRGVIHQDKFHIIFCRNLVFTYFDASLQQQMLSRMRDRLLPGGVLVIGVHEALPAGSRGFVRWPGSRGVYLRVRNQ